MPTTKLMVGQSHELFILAAHSLLHLRLITGLLFLIMFIATRYEEYRPLLNSTNSKPEDMAKSQLTSTL